jgi:hypothetical protein
MADIPMEWMAPGAERQSAPFDHVEFMRRLNSQNETP